MNLLVLMYHRAAPGRHGNSPEMLDAHFQHIAATYPHVLPGGAVAPGVLNVCLTFDDGYFDFYAKVFPLLQKHRLRALLAIPPAVIRERTEASTATRLGLSQAEAFAHPSKGGFCTWPELQEMTDGGSVRVAAHGYSHCSLAAPDADLATEVQVPRTLLGSRLGRPVDSFLFPFGRFSRPALRMVRQNYRYTFRIGSAMNSDWRRPLLYRVDADAMPSPEAPFSRPRVLGYRARSLWHRLRRR